MQKIDLYQPIESASVGSPPLVVNVQVTKTADHVMGGVPQSQTRVESYVLLSALPEEIKRRVIMAVQALQSGM